MTDIDRDAGDSVVDFYDWSAADFDGVVGFDCDLEIDEVVGIASGDSAAAGAGADDDLAGAAQTGSSSYWKLQPRRTHVDTQPDKISDVNLAENTRNAEWL